MADRPVAKDRPDNLFAPQPQLADTHGIFDQQAKDRSLQLWLSTHRSIAVGAMVGSAAVAAGAWKAMRP
jgi:hypothetical protein